MGARLVPKGHARLVEGDVPLIELSTLFLTAYRITAYRNTVAYRLPRLPRLPLTGASAYRLPQEFFNDFNLTAYRYRLPQEIFKISNYRLPQPVLINIPEGGVSTPGVCFHTL